MGLLSGGRWGQRSMGGVVGGEWIVAFGGFWLLANEFFQLIEPIDH